MGCNKSRVRVGPADLVPGMGRKNASRLQNMWRRFGGANKVGPAKRESLEQPESVLYTENKPDYGAPNQGLIKTAWGEVNQTQAKILLELQTLGIVSFNTTASGAISFSVGSEQTTGTGAALPPRRPPARLARLDRVPSLPDSQKAEELENKMKAAEARRKKKQDALKERLRAHSRLGQHHYAVAAEAERALKQKTAVKIAVKQVAFQERVGRLNEARTERVRAKSRAGEHAREFAKEADELVRFEAAEMLAKKQERFENQLQQKEAERMDRIRAKSRLAEHAKEVAEKTAKDSQEKAAEAATKKQETAKANNERRERFRTQRVLLNAKHRENIRRALARRLAEEEENEYDMDYEIETAQDSENEVDDFFDACEPELQWLM
ncbi:coiled-coil domain-containing protein 177-like [Patiria miniata]|uniref:Uncharacterized protein n=1 Tax=Patiria miniata TaxID=46514 RepID=A0A914A2T0_PATMI|nr:coiled-coil domain-containing protein 177-like [Patiria miniata]